MNPSVLSRMLPGETTLTLRYQPADWSPPEPMRTLFVIAPAGARPVGVRAPLIDLPTESLGVSPLIEVWESDDPVSIHADDGLVASRAGDMLVGAVTTGPDENLCAATRRIYYRILELSRSVGTPHLVRIWNYFPRINVIEGIERYQQFCVARFDALAAAGYDMTTDLPAASAVGSRDGRLTVVFLATSRRPRYVENPRQMSAFSYPQQYGPRSPSFSRGAVLADGRTLLVSGTASIVGHRTVHQGDPAAQVDETLRNLDAVAAAAFGNGMTLRSPSLETLLKVYVRRPEDQPAVASRLEQIVPAEAISYLHADICRADLLVEIEAVIRRS